MSDKNNTYEIFSEYYLLKVNQFNEVAKDSLDEWIYFLKTGEIKDGFKARALKEAKKKPDVKKISDEERRIYDRFIENYR